MMGQDALKAKIDSREFAAIMDRLYGPENRVYQTRRWSALAEQAGAWLDLANCRLFSAPGRTELGGNHTDHNQGCVVAAAVDMDCIAVASPRPDQRVVIRSAGFDPIEVDLATTEPRLEEQGKSAALVRGVADFLRSQSIRVGGFSAQVASTVLPGSGLSSSAAFEVLVAGIMSGLHHGSPVDPMLLARAGQWAENRHFGKPCGLMDQAASALGGVVGLDFADPAQPKVQKVNLDPQAFGYSLVVVDTGGNHADLTADYAAIPAEMRAVARFFGKGQLRELDQATLLRNLANLRPAVGDRAVLRAMHFFAESERAIAQVKALAQGNFLQFLALVRASGHSSASRLQNIIPAAADGREQGLALALALSQDILAGEGAFRVHGGGFAGTIQAWVPQGRLENYKEKIEMAFGADSVRLVRIRIDGVREL